MNKKSIAAGLVAGGLMLVSGSAMAASQPRMHDGTYLRLSPNLGMLSATRTVEGASGELTISGFSTGFDFMIGGTVTKGLVIGGALVGSSASKPKMEGKFGALTVSGNADGSMLFAGVGVFANYYFDPAQGFYVQPLVGFATEQVVNPDGTAGDSPSGTMFGIGAGYDFWVGDEWSIGPTGRLIYAPLSLDVNGGTIKQNSINFTVGVEFVFH